MKLLYGGQFVVKSSGAKIRGQMWLCGNQTRFYDGVNWYDGKSVEFKPN